mmetsp:Transcript_30211/g.77569  ORF Transcript_30211/g.77569 Transcript_30211/m.77569 type:complete len:210 (-) Transcript_30211:1119-1748(-)
MERRIQTVVRRRALRLAFPPGARGPTPGAYRRRSARSPVLRRCRPSPRGAPCCHARRASPTCPTRVSTRCRSPSTVSTRACPIGTRRCRCACCGGLTYAARRTFPATKRYRSWEPTPTWTCPTTRPLMRSGMPPRWSPGAGAAPNRCRPPSRASARCRGSSCGNSGRASAARTKASSLFGWTGPASPSTPPPRCLKSRGASCTTPAPAP